MGEIIRMENVVKMTAQGYRTINDVSLAIQENECVEFSGAANERTSLMRIIAGMDKPSFGYVFVQDMPLHDLNEHEAADFRNRVFGIVQGDPSLLPYLTVWENVALPLMILGNSLADRKKSAFELMESLGFQYAANARPAQLSPYEVKLASIARALIAKPKILMLFEATTDLSMKEADRLADVVQALLQSGEYTLLNFAETEKQFNAGIQYRLRYGSIQEGN